MEDKSLNEIFEIIEREAVRHPHQAEAAFYMNPNLSLGNGGFHTMPAEVPQQERKKPTVKILEQPASKALRFRYECEGRLAGSIPGIHSTADNKTYPTIKVEGYQGRAVVVVSCVTKDQPYRPHPHSIVGREGCKKGVCTLEFNNPEMIYTFSNLGIQCVKKKGIEEALRQRKEIRVDPFPCSSDSRQVPPTIDLNVVRLCFQVFLEGPQRGKFNVALKPVVSDPIYDKKAMCDLTISKLSDCTSPANGGKEIILLCDKVVKDDIRIRFFEEQNGQIVWESYGEFSSSDVHKQVAVSFRTPRYKLIEIVDAVKVYLHLVRPSDGAISETRAFHYVPSISDADIMRSRRKRLLESSSSCFNTNPLDIMRNLESNNHPWPLNINNVDYGAAAAAEGPGRHRIVKKVKKEPYDPTYEGGANNWSAQMAVPTPTDSLLHQRYMDYRTVQASPDPRYGVLASPSNPSSYPFNQSPLPYNIVPSPVSPAENTLADDDVTVRQLGMVVQDNAQVELCDLIDSDLFANLSMTEALDGSVKNAPNNFTSTGAYEESGARPRTNIDSSINLFPDLFSNLSENDLK